MASLRKLKSGKWQVSIRKPNHKGVYKTFAEKALAKKWARQVEVQIDRDVYTDYGNAETITIKDLIIKYRDEIVPEHKAKKSTTHKLNKLMRYNVSLQHLLRLRSSDIYKMQKKMQSEGLAPKTVNTYVQLLNQIWTTARRIWSINLPAQSPFELVTLQRVRNERDRVLTHAEYKRLLECAEQSELHMLRDIIVFAYKTGARIMEILNLKRDDTDLYKKLATFKDTKNGTDRTIPLANEVVEILKRYPFGDRFFKVKSYDSFNYFFKQARDRAMISDFRFHDLRACFCTNALLSGMSELQVATISGHLDLRSLKRYSRIKAEDLIEKINKINLVKMSG
jgi:integrase